MRKMRKSTVAILHRAGSLLLVLLLFSATLIQVAHSHNTYAAPTGTETGFYADDDCLICDYCIHQAGKEMLSDWPPAIDVPLPEPVVLHGRVFARIYKFTLQGFTNKGPPTFSC